MPSNEGRAKDFAVFILDLPLLYLATDRLSLGGSEKLKPCDNYAKESQHHHRRNCVIFKLVKVFLSGVSCTENCFYQTLGNFPGITHYKEWFQ